LDEVLVQQKYFSSLSSTGCHRRSQGVLWVHVHPRGRRKKLGGQIYEGKVVSERQRVHPREQSKSPIRRSGRWERLFRQF